MVSYYLGLRGLLVNRGIVNRRSYLKMRKVFDNFGEELKVNGGLTPRYKVEQANELLDSVIEDLEKRLGKSD